MRTRTPLEITLGPLIGSGSHGSVYAVKDNHTRALKVLPQDRQDHSLREAVLHDNVFQASVSLSAKSGEPRGVLPIWFHGDFIHRGDHTITFGRVLCLERASCTLSDKLPAIQRQAQTDRNRASLNKIFIDAFSCLAVHGLAALAQAKVAHCDLKNDNILVLDNGELAISDFSCATQYEQYNDKSCATGAPVSRAPEKFAPGNYFPLEGDTWAIGYILMQMLGITPYFDMLSMPGANKASIIEENEYKFRDYRDQREKEGGRRIASVEDDEQHQSSILTSVQSKATQQQAYLCILNHMLHPLPERRPKLATIRSLASILLMIGTPVHRTISLSSDKGAISGTILGAISGAISGTVIDSTAAEVGSESSEVNWGQPKVVTVPGQAPSRLTDFFKTSIPLECRELNSQSQRDRAAVLPEDTVITLRVSTTQVSI